MTDIFEYLRNNSYPGRGLIIGRYDGEPVIAYFIMGRSENSRNRIFCKDRETVYTKAYDETKVKDPSLIIYNAIRHIDGMIVVTNGDQTDTICEFIEKGLSFQEALETREYEPDSPNYTPRISGIVERDGSYQIEILKREDDHCRRDHYRYLPEEGKGHFISTYDHNGDPLPSFSQESIEIEIKEGLGSFAEKLWDSLDHDNRISLYVRFGNADLLFNKHGGQL